MIQCIAPYITIDQVAFHASLAQYQRFLDRTRYACTTHHPDWLDSIKEMLPNIPLINPPPKELAPPRHDHTHQHLDFEYGWGIGPIVDSYGGMYRLAGAIRRIPGYCKLELFDHKVEEQILDDINKHGETNEYVHPICYYRDLIRGPEAISALHDFDRKFIPGNNGGKGRFWWTRKGDTKKLPEWVILPHGDDEVNYERTWYGKSEKSERILKKLEDAGYEKDWLQTLDDQIDFGVWDKKGWEYP